MAEEGGAATTDTDQSNSVVLEDSGTKTGASAQLGAQQDTRCSLREIRRLKQVAEAKGMGSNAVIGCVRATVTDKLPPKH